MERFGVPMSPWPGKFVIGLTGNIATGKSVVRRMLEHLGAYGIDADALSHRAMSRGAPGYEPIIDYFGKWILAADGQVDRVRLGRIVFNDPVALAKLESILHPLVRQAVSILARRAGQPVIVIEAIKLLESELRRACDSIWVTNTGQAGQMDRLVRKRGLSEAEARLRIAAQAPQADKLKAAHVIIENRGSVENTWRQVVRAWETNVPKVALPEQQPVAAATADLSVTRAGPEQAREIADFITALSNGKNQVSRTDIMEAFGDMAFMLLRGKDELYGVVGWQVENLVSRATQFHIDPRLDLSDVAPGLLEAVEKASRDLQSEASLLFLPPRIAQEEEIWTSLGYQEKTIDELGVRAWQDAARESHIRGTRLYFKQLRTDRVLRPI